MKIRARWLTAAAAVLVMSQATNSAADDRRGTIGEEGTDTTEARVTNPLTTSLPPEPPVLYRQRDLSGPRVGLTMAPGDGETYRTLREHGMGRVVSQFGWHFEHQIVPLGQGPQLVTEAIPLVGGVEYGKFIPSLNFAIGVRTRQGYEFGMGPSFTAITSGGDVGSVALALAVGRTLDYGGISLPLNVAVTTNRKGTRISVLAGYAIRRASY